MKVTKNFHLQEFVDEETYKQYGEMSVRFIRPSCFRIAQKLRDRFGPTLINTWHVGGKRNWSGLRTPKSSLWSPTSLHSWGGATDKVFSLVTVEEVRKDIIDNPYTYAEITRIEDDVDWIHTDDMFTGKKEIVVFKPDKNKNV